MIEKKIIEILTRCATMVDFQDAPDEAIEMTKQKKFVLDKKQAKEKTTINRMDSPSSSSSSVTATTVATASSSAGEGSGES